MWGGEEDIYEGVGSGVCHHYGGGGDAGTFNHNHKFQLGEFRD